LRHAGPAVRPARPDDTPITALGLDSLQRLELVAALEKSFGGHMPDAAYAQVQTLGELVAAAQKHLIEGPRAADHAGLVPPEHYDFARFPEYIQLKHHERMLWTVTRDNPYFRADQGGAGAMALSTDAQLVNFCVYDYVGMARDSRSPAAAKAAIDRYGTTRSQSRLVSGENRCTVIWKRPWPHFWMSLPRSCSSPDMPTNVTTIGHLLGPGDLILHDALAHNSIIQGAAFRCAVALSPITTGWSWTRC
jgi:acyl carrier protein